MQYPFFPLPERPVIIKSFSVIPDTGARLMNDQARAVQCQVKVLKRVLVIRELSLIRGDDLFLSAGNLSGSQ
jgi:hypothetical protein